MARTFLPLAMAFALMSTTADAAIYSFNRTVGVDGIAFGFFETDGTIGAIGVGNIIDYAVSWQDNEINGGTLVSYFGDGPVDPFSPFGLGVAVASGDLVATATDLLFNFDGDSVLSVSVTSFDFWCVSGALASLVCYVDGTETLGASDVTGTEAEFTPYQGFTSIASVSTVPVPAGLPLLLTGLAGFGLAGLRKKKRSA